MTLLYDDLLGSGSAIYFYDLQSAPSLGSNPNVSSTTPVRYQGNATITGTNFGASAGQVTIGGIVQPIVSWAATSIVIGPVNRATLKYGNQSLVVQDSSSVNSSPFNLTLLPQTGWDYVNLAFPLAAVVDRLETTPPLVVTDQVAWGNISPTGTVTVFSDASFSVSSLVSLFAFEVNDGSGWGASGLQTFGAVTTFAGVLASLPSALAGAFNNAVSGTTSFSGTMVSGTAALTGTFSAFVSATFSGAIQSGLAWLIGAFTVTGEVPPVVLPPSTGGGGDTPQSRVAIINQALAKLGVSPIESLQEGSKAARTAVSLYYTVLNQELARHFWKFAVARKQIDEWVSDNYRGPFHYMYSLPSDWLTTIWVGDLGTGDLPNAIDGDPLSEWAHEGRFILTNYAPPLPLVYVRRVTDTSEFHALFAEAFACRLAMEMSDPLTNSEKKWEKCRIMYNDALKDAKRLNATMDPPRYVPGDTWINSRL